MKQSFCMHRMLCKKYYQRENNTNIYPVHENTFKLFERYAYSKGFLFLANEIPMMSNLSIEFNTF